jgi:hypothetical protein
MMMGVNKRLVYGSLLFLVVAVLALGIGTAIVEEALVFDDNSTINYLRYDRIGTSLLGDTVYGSDSYMDSSPTTPNLFLNVCHPNLAEGQRIDLAYYSESRNLTDSILNYRPSVVHRDTYSDSNGTYYCSKVDVDLSSARALYPGRLITIIYDDNHTLNNMTNESMYYMLDPMLQNMSGRYHIGVNVEGPPKVFYITPTEAMDEFEVPITREERHLLVSVVNSNETILSEGRIAPGESIEYTAGFRGGEKVYVNGIPSLEIKSYQPCDRINESGYYIMNESKLNINDTCIFINSSTAIVVNFGGEMLGGDNLENGSKRENVCAVNVINSINITLEDVHAQLFQKGICVTNSTLHVFGMALVYNEIGAFITDNSTVVISDLTLSNNNSEVAAYNDSLVKLIMTNLTSATIKTDFKDTIVKSVPIPPPMPPNSSLLNISQWVQLTKSDSDGYAQLNFYYPEPLPNKVAANNISIYRFNGTFSPGQEYVVTAYNDTYNITLNITLYNNSGWANGSWKKVFTLISPSERLIISPNMTNYSVFAPFGLETNSTAREEPEPIPVPTPSPSGGGAGTAGAGAGPSQPGETELQRFLQTIKLDLKIPDNITLMQGEAGRVYFNLTNKGNVSVYDLVVDPKVNQWWDKTNTSIPLIRPNTMIEDYFQIAPYDKAVAMTYYVPVTLTTIGPGNVTVKVIERLLKVIVIPRGNLSRIKILEYSPTIKMAPATFMNVSFVAQNIGDMDLANITVQYNPNDCIIDVTGSTSIKKGEIKVLSYLVRSNREGVCDVNFEFISKGKMVGFVPLTFDVNSRNLTAGALVKRYILIALLIGWTILTAVVLNKRRKQEKK